MNEKLDPGATAEVESLEMIDIAVEFKRLAQRAKAFDGEGDRSGHALYEQLGMMVVAMYEAGSNPVQVLDLIERIAEMPEAEITEFALLSAVRTLIGDDAAPLLVVPGDGEIN